MDFSSGSLLSFLVAVSFAAGLNVYATTLTLGVLAHFHWVALPGGLQALGNPWVMGAAGALFCCEMFADKIPFVDLVWNFAHTFVRIPLAGLLAYKASSQLTPEMQALVVLAAAGIAAIAHSSKTAARVVATGSPEPFSNIALSAGEDLTSVGLTWVATRHPVSAAIVVGALVLVAVFSVRWIVRSLRNEMGKMRARWASN
jgi:hypothetical protein